jgi:hypothetical protein
LQLESGIDMAFEDGTEKDMYISANTSVIRFVGGLQIGTATDIVGFYGTTPVAANSTFVAGASTAAHIITELTRLGLVS